MSRPPPGLSQLLPLILTLGPVALVYGWLLAPQLAKPFVYDDVNFILGAQAIARTGLPFGNQGYLLHLTDQREQWALWHPPLYLYVLGATIAAFGTTEAVARSITVVCQLLSLGLAVDISRRLAGTGPLLRGSGPIAAAATAVLLLLNPLNVQSALILDIDNTVLMLLLTAFTWLAVGRPGPWDRQAIAVFAVLYAIALWAKMTTPLVLLAALTFTRFFQGEGVRGARDALTVGALGWGLFVVSWFGVTAVAGMPWDYTLIVAYREAIDSSASTRDRFVSLGAFVDGAAPAWLWIGPFFCLLFLVAGLPRLWAVVRGRRLCPADLAIVLGAAIYLVYIMKLAGNYPKYHAAMLPLWAAAGGALIARCTKGANGGQLTVFLAGTLTALTWLTFRMGGLWETQLYPELVKLLLVVPGIVGLCLLALWAQLGRQSPFRALPVALFGLTLAWSVALDIHQRDLPGSTTYYYGRDGQVQTARALSQRLRPDELYVASKEVAWYASGQHYVDQESWQHEVWGERRGFDGTWRGQEIRLLALEVGEISARWGYEKLLGGHYRVVGEFGNFLLFERD